MITKDCKEQFLLKLEALTRETGIAIAGCGCCGSPWLEEVSVVDQRAGYGTSSAGEVCWIAPDGSYNWKNFKQTIVKEKE